MKVGIIADTHDNLPLIDKTAQRLNKEGIELVLHAGDYVAPFAVVKLLKQLKPRLIGVFGNNDGDRELLKKRFAEFTHAEIRGDFAEIIIDNLRIALMHGHTEELLQSLVKSESYDLVIHGHTHEAKIYRNGKTIVINPGEVCGYLYGRSTVAILETQTKQASIIEI